MYLGLKIFGVKLALTIIESIVFSGNYHKIFGVDSTPNTLRVYGAIKMRNKEEDCLSDDCKSMEL